MSNQLITMEELTTSVLAHLKRICDEEGVPEDQRLKILIASFVGLMDGPMCPEDFDP